MWLATQARIKTSLKLCGTLSTRLTASNFSKEFQAKWAERHYVRLGEVWLYKTDSVMPSDFDCRHLVVKES